MQVLDSCNTMLDNVANHCLPQQTVLMVNEYVLIIWVKSQQTRMTFTCTKVSVTLKEKWKLSYVNWEEF